MGVECEAQTTIDSTSFCTFGPNESKEGYKEGGGVPFTSSVEVVMGDGVLVEEGRGVVITTTKTTSNLIFF